jgi:2,3-bisphosphoglycerate-independent phosphoglycerate mutase
MGNSEVGHLNLGAGRVVYQEFTRVTRSIRTGSFYTNQALTGAVDLAETEKYAHLTFFFNGGAEPPLEGEARILVPSPAMETYDRQPQMSAAIRAIETRDHCLGRAVDVLGESGGQMLVTADHGNAEQMLDHTTDQAHTAHTSKPVSLVYVGPKAVRLDPKGGALCDVAPTLLDLMDLPQPSEMQGKSLLRGADRGT